MATRSMLEYSKIILEKVSFDIQLFHKELRKAIARLAEPEIKELTHWAQRNFAPQMALLPAKT